MEQDKQVPNLPELLLYWTARPQSSGTHRDNPGTWQSTENCFHWSFCIFSPSHRVRVNLRLYLAFWASPKAVWQKPLSHSIRSNSIFSSQSVVSCFFFFSSNLNRSNTCEFHSWESKFFWLYQMKLLKNVLCAQEALWCNGRRPGFLPVPTLLCELKYIHFPIWDIKWWGCGLMISKYFFNL